MVGTTVVFTTAVVWTWLAYTRLLSASSMSTPIMRSAFPLGTMVEIFAFPFEYRTWAETAPFLIASPFLSLNRTWYPSLVPARARTDDITPTPIPPRSEEHTSELQSRSDLVCRLLLEKK